MGDRKEIEQMFDSRNPPPAEKERKKKMERTYVCNFIFRVMSIIGIVSIFGLAGASDFGTIENAELFLGGSAAFLAAAVGIWGASNCTRAIRAVERRQKRERSRQLRVITNSRAA